MAIVGIYKILNIINGKCYVGSSSNLKLREYQHFRMLKAGNHINNKLQNAWNKYGQECFIFEIVVECKIEDLVLKEQHFINSLNSVSEGYNLAPTAGISTLGFKHSEESRLKMSKSKTGKKLPRSAEHQEKLTNSQRDKPKTEEQKRKISESLKGRKASPSARENMRKAAVNKIRQPVTEQARKNMSIAQKKRFSKNNIAIAT